MYKTSASIVSLLHLRAFPISPFLQNVVLSPFKGYVDVKYDTLYISLCYLNSSILKNKFGHVLLLQVKFNILRHNLSLVNCFKISVLTFY